MATHLNYLCDAAHLLAEAAPETSAYMMSCRTSLMLAHELLPSDVQKQHVCGACGHIMIPGHGTTLKIESERALRNRKRCHGSDRKKPPSKSGPAKVFSCGHCRRETKVALPPPGPISREKTHGRAAGPAALRGTEVQKPTANAISKKRAKSRKAGLQALIQTANETNKASTKFSLADFMKR